MFSPLPKIKTLVGSAYSMRILLGFLINIYPDSLLDVGSGRGVFLFPLLNEFSNLNITSLYNKNFKWIKIFIMLAAYAYLIYTFVNFEYYEDFSSYFKLYGLENVKYLIFCYYSHVEVNL